MLVLVRHPFGCPLVGNILLGMYGSVGMTLDVNIGCIWLRGFGFQLILVSIPGHPYTVYMSRSLFNRYLCYNLLMF